MFRSLTQSEFVEKATAVHGSKYDYSKSVYTRSRENVSIVCNRCGCTFSQKPNNHLSGCGCRVCAFLDSSERNSNSLDWFLEQANKTHGNRYNYDSVEYKNSKAKVRIKCNTCHSEFSQSPEKHISGNGCRKCSDIRGGKKRRIGKDDFISRSKEIHGDRYVYNKIKYKNNQVPVEIECQMHGSFFQRPCVHLLGCGCPRCGSNEVSKKAIESSFGWSHSEWAKAGERSKYFKGFKFYLLRLESESEVFFKVGRTFNDISVRFGNSIAMPYDYRVLSVTEASANEICELEDLIKSEIQHRKYTPRKPFRGMHECYK